MRKSLVLLKNGKGSQSLLPLNKNATKILIVGAHADDLGLQCGGWTITWQGQAGNNITKGSNYVTSVLFFLLFYLYIYFSVSSADDIYRN